MGGHSLVTASGQLKGVLVSRPHPARPSRLRRRLVGVALAAVAVAGLGSASAAQLVVGSETLAAGAAAVGDCQGSAPLRVQLVSGWDTGENPDAFTTTAVIVHDVAGACVGQSLRVTLVAGDGAALSEVSLPSIATAGIQPQLDLTAELLTSTIDHAEIIIHS